MRILARQPDLANGSYRAQAINTQRSRAVAGRTMSLVMMFALSLAACSSGGGGDGDSDGQEAGTDATLSALSIDGVAIDQIFQPGQTSYTAAVGYLRSSVSLTATTGDPNATLTLDGAAIDSGTEQTRPLVEGSTSSEAGVTDIELVVTAEDGTTTNAYSLSVTRAAASSFANRAFLKASTVDDEDEFGISVALSGDTLLVGAPREDSAATGGESDNTKANSGAAYVFVRNGAAWEQQAFLKADDAFDQMSFGAAVALEGDTAVIGAPQEGNSGAVYVFTRTNTTWSQLAKLKASNAEAGDEFGTSVRLAVDTLVVGAPLEDSSLGGTNGNDTGATDDDSVSDSGAVYVFVRSGSQWSQDAYIKADNADVDDNFGMSVGLSGDVMVVGAPGEDSNSNISNELGDNTGAAYVYTRTGSGWSNPQRLKASNLGNFDEFGAAVAVYGDTLVVCAWTEDGESNAVLDSGAAYVFVNNGATWGQTAILRALNAGDSDQFGSSVAISAGGIVIGAIWETFTSTNGAAYVFTGSGSSWSQYRYLSSIIKTAGVIGSNTALLGDNYGVSVAIDGDTVVVGANGEDSSTALDETDNGSVDSGAAYVWK